MFRCLCSVVLILSFNTLSHAQAEEEKDSGWRISPRNINIQVGADRSLQLLDDLAQELRGTEWSVNEPSLAEIHEEDGRVVLHAKAAGTVRVSAVLGREKRFREIRIWPLDQPLPVGTTSWGMQPIGRDIRDLAAVPTPDGPNMFSLEQTASGSTYLRAVAEDGYQVWTWLMPEKTRDVELVCGDWLGGALISANRGSSYTLYTVGNDGKLRWQHTVAGIRKGHAYGQDNLVHVLSQSPDGTVTKVTGFDGVTGDQRFDLTVPGSHEKRINVRKAGTKVLCAEGSSSAPVRTGTSRLFVNIDGFAYVAFTQQEWELGAAKCTPGAVVDPADVNQARSQRVLLWQIHPDGTHRSSVVEESTSNGPLSQPLSVGQPTGSLIPDGLGGVLLSVGWSRIGQKIDAKRLPDEFVYRLDQDGKVVFEFPLPQYDGVLKDEMVLGEDERGFVTRGSLLIAFSVRDGREIWRWDSHTPGIEVFAALANGGCMVQTPTALVELDNSTDSKQIFKGKAMLDWKGQLYRKVD